MSVGEQSGIGNDDLRRALGALGLGAGDSVVVHGSLKSFGRVDGGAEALVAAVIDTVGADGLVTMPVYAESRDEAGSLLPEPSASAPITTGAIPAAFARRPDVFLARHPMYAFAYYGRDAAMLARSCERLMFPYGIDQPLYCLCRRRGWILQLGVGETTNTSIHVAEEMADPPYLEEKRSQSRLSVDAFLRLTPPERAASLARHQAGPRRDFRKVTPLIEEAGLRRTARVGEARVALTDFVGLCTVLSEAIRRQPDLMVVPRA